jgi:arginase
MRKIRIINVPISTGCDKSGVDLAPQYFLDQGIVSWFEREGHVVDTLFIQGSIVANVLTEKFAECAGVKYLSEVYTVNTNLRDIVSQTLRDGYFPMIIGGDHSLGLGSMAGVSESFSDVGVIWFDAHGDINTEATSPSGNSHGMPCAAAIGLCSSKLNDVCRKRLNPQNFFWIGARDLDEGERKYMEDNNLNVYSADFIREHGMLYVIKDVLKKIEQNGIKNIHCSIDIDAKDPSIVSATGTPVPNGLQELDYDVFINELFAKINVVSCDFVEFNPLIQGKESTFEWCKRALCLISEKL